MCCFCNSFFPWEKPREKRRAIHAAQPCPASDGLALAWHRCITDPEKKWNPALHPSKQIQQTHTNSCNLQDVVSDVQPFFKSPVSFGILGSPAQVPKAIGPESPKIDDQQPQGPTAKVTPKRWHVWFTATTPPKTNMEPEKGFFWRRKNIYTNHQFWGSMLVFWGCNSKKTLVRLTLQSIARVHGFVKHWVPVMCSETPVTHCDLARPKCGTWISPAIYLMTISYNTPGLYPISPFSWRVPLFSLVYLWHHSLVNYPKCSFDLIYFGAWWILKLDSQNDQIYESKTHPSRRGAYGDLQQFPRLAPGNSSWKSRGLNGPQKSRKKSTRSVFFLSNYCISRLYMYIHMDVMILIYIYTRIDIKSNLNLTVIHKSPGLGSASARKGWRLVWWISTVNSIECQTSQSAKPGSHLGVVVVVVVVVLVLWIKHLDPTHMVRLMKEIPNNHLGCKKACK